METRFCNELRSSTTLRAFKPVILLVMGLMPGLAACADSIYVVDGAESGTAVVTAARTELSNLGYSVTHGSPLANYSGFSQVWDLRYSTAISGAEFSAYNSYLSGGGRLYLTGEGSSFAARNTSVISYVNQAGGGLMTISNGFLGTQHFTIDGQIVNNPNLFSSLSYNVASTVSISSGNGFLVTEDKTTSTGSLVGWDFGDISGNPNARMLVGFDIDIFQMQNAQNWTQDMAHFLGAAEPAAVPLPLTAWMGMALFSCLAGRRILRTKIGVI
jgi:hypothetical protein